MAGRLQKVGLDFFPLSVSIWEDDKIKFIRPRFGEKGELLVIKLLQNIYRHKGYYMDWNEDEALSFAEGAGKNITAGLANDLVNELLKREFFDGTMHMRFSILTSHNIQRTYERICKDAGRKGPFIKTEHRITAWNIVTQPLPPPLIELTGKEMPITPQEITQRKGKERKENETKEDDESGSAIVGREKVYEKNILGDQIFYERSALVHKWKSREEYEQAVNEFFNRKVGTGECNQWKSEQDAKSNFWDWIPKYQGGKLNGNSYKKHPEPTPTFYTPPSNDYRTGKTEKIDPSQMLKMKNLVDSDIDQIKVKPDLKPLLAAMKFDHLQKEKLVKVTPEVIAIYTDQARGERIREIHTNMEDISNRALAVQYKNNSEPESEQTKIKILAKEMAYLDWLKEQISKPQTVEP